MNMRIGAVLAVVLLGGCLGKPGPVEQYLRVSPQAGGCADTQAVKAVSVGVKRFDTADALDRQSVMLAQGRVMSPSLRWYWEASPGEMIEQNLASAINCTPGLAAVTPVRSSSEVSFVVSGAVTAFAVQSEGRTLEVAVRVQLWEGSGGKALGASQFAATQPVQALDAASIADAGARAVAEVSASAAQWVRAVTAKAGAK